MEITTREAPPPEGTRPLATTRSAPAIRRILGAFWGARGWWGGLIAMSLAVFGQQAMITQNDQATAGRYYTAAVVLLIAVLLHPRLPAWRPWRKSGAPTAAAAAAPPLPVRPVNTPADADLPPATVPVRRVHTGSPVAQANDAEPAAADRGLLIRPNPKSKIQNLKLVRARWGWQITAGGLALTLALAGAGALVLNQEITNPLGGWLWAAALAALLLTFVGAAGWPRGGGLLPGPRSDFFAPGVPSLPFRWEAVLVVGMIGIALALRLYNLEGIPGIFGDEGERGMDARAINEGRPALIFSYGWWGVPNLYFYIVSWMLRLFGDTMTGDRMLSVISGVAAVWFVYRIGRLLWGPRAGLIAGLLLTVSPLALQFSRLAGESTPTGALWAAGFFYFFLALRHRRPSDWVLAGMLWGFSLYFYAAGKLIIPLIALVGAYCLVRWHIEFVKRYLPGFILLGLAFVLVFLPYAMFSAKENPPWMGFTGRAQETSIFSPQNAPQAFAKYNIPYKPPTTGNQSLVQQVLADPQGWTQLITQQMRVTSEVIYRSGDPTPFYQIPEHAGSMLAPIWAAIALLGLAYGAWKFWDGRFGLASLWFWGGMLGAALTMDTPSVQRLTGAWPVIMLFPAVLLDRVCAATWPFSVALARRWSIVPLIPLLAFFAGDSYREYFIHFGAICSYCTPTTQARYAQGLGQEYKAYQLGVGGYDVFFGYGSTRFAAKGVEGADLAVPADFFPIIDNHGKGAAFIVYQPNADYLPLIQLFYPMGKQEVITGTDGSAVFTSVKVTREQMAATQTLHARYAPAGGPEITRDEPNLGTLRPAEAPAPWSPPPGLTYPARATWQGGLVAPAYGLYSFGLLGPADAALEVDGAPVLAMNGQSDQQPVKVSLVLAKGVHAVRLTGTLADTQSRIAVQWAGGNTPLAPLPANYLTNGSTGGLSAEIRPYVNPSVPLTDDAVFGGAVSARRSDPFIGYREATVALGNAPFVARWQGTLQAPVDGPYNFETSATGPTLVLIDGQPVVNAAGNGGAGQVTLTAGPHPVEVRWAWPGGTGRMEWFWTPPGSARVLVPPTVLHPLARSWTPGTVPDPTAAMPDLRPPAPPPTALRPETILGADAGLKEPRGIGVDQQGHIFVGDSANHRVVRLGADGKAQTQWGQATQTSAPGAFNLLADLAVTPDGHVVTLDAGNGDVQAFDAEGKALWQRPGLATNASGIAFGPDGSVWVSNTGGGHVAHLTPQGQAGAVLFGGVEGSRTRFDQPVDVAVAPDGTVYAVDLRGRIVRLDAAGNVVTEWPVAVGTARGGSHLAVWQDHVVMTDPDRNRLAVVDLASGETRYVGGVGTGPGQFRLPIGVAAGPDGKLYVVDSDNARVQVFSTLDQQ